MPIVSLLGGMFRDKIRVYASARKVVADGFKAVKIAIGAGGVPDLESIDIVREVVGGSFTIMVDAGGIYDYQTALMLATELEKRGVFWFEAPLPLDDFSGYVELSQKTGIMITNDMIWTTGLVKDALQRGGKVVYIPEVLKAGGNLECKQIADLADRFGVPFAPHVSQGSYIQYAATAHVCASAPNFLISEFWWQDNPLDNRILKNPLQIKDGYMEVPTGPGIGVEVDEEANPFVY